jgi:putative ABC transport system permease protein
MFRTTLKSLFAHKLRLLASALAITLGVAFMTGTLVLSDTIQQTFDQLFAGVYQGTDAVVRSTVTLDNPQGGPATRAEVPQSLVPVVASAPGVERALGGTTGYAQLIGHDGKAIGDPNRGAPTLGVSWDGTSRLNPFRIATGRAPTRAGEVAIDRKTAKDDHFSVGQSIDVLTKGGRRSEQIVGIATFGTQNSLLGATVTIFDQDTAARLLGHPGMFSGIRVQGRPGVSQQQLVTAISGRLPAHTQAITGAAATKESQDQIQQALSFFSTFLLVFAVIALFVGSFIIYNTFSIIVAQRTREMALLRAIGASRAQVLGSVLGEAFVVGLISAILGLGFGILVAIGLKALLSGLGLGIPASGAVVHLSSVVVAFIAGVGVTMVVAIAPAIRASRVSPMAALREINVDRSAHSLLRTVMGLLVLALGVAALFLGLFGNLDNGIAVVGGGALITFLGVAVLGPVIAAPISNLIGAPVARLKGVTGRLARQNATRNPKRTSSTAAALMIGVGLMAFFSIFAASATASVNQTIDSQFHGQFFIDSGQTGQTDGAGLPHSVVARIRNTPGVTAALAVQLGNVDLNGTGDQIPGFQTDVLPKLGDIDVRQGSLDDLGVRQIAVSQKFADDNQLRLGSKVTAKFLDPRPVQLTVAVIYHDADLVGEAFLSSAGFAAHFPNYNVQQIYVAADASQLTSVRAALDRITAPYPTAKVEDVAEFKASQTQGVNTLLGLIYVLLGLAVVIALLGIVNTLALSIFERTHEIGLMRAVGMSRRQTRSVIRWEAVITALLGTLLGLIIGLFFGWSVVKSLGDSGIHQLAIPVGQLVVVVIVAALAGVLAAILPARRAARLDVLAAIGTD